MNCPNCDADLTDALDFDAPALTCPHCQRPFTPFEIMLMPLNEKEEDKPLLWYSEQMIQGANALQLVFV